MVPAKYQGACWVLIAACFYAGTALLGKWLHLLQIPIVTAFSWRYAIAALIFSILYQFQKAQDLPWESKIRCFSIGFLGDTTRSMLFFITVSRLGASLASLLLYTFPFFIFLIQRFVFRRAATRMQWLGLLISSFGCVLAIAPLQDGGIAWDGLGIVTGIGVGLIQAGYISYSDHFIRGIPTLTLTTYVMRGAFMMSFLAALSKGVLALPHNSTEWMLALSLAICATAAPIFCLMKGIRMTGATQTSLLLMIEPVVTMGLAFMIYGEPLTLTKILGGFLIIGSAWLIQRKPPQEALQTTQI